MRDGNLRLSCQLSAILARTPDVPVCASLVLSLDGLWSVFSVRTHFSDGRVGMAKGDAHSADASGLPAIDGQVYAGDEAGFIGVKEQAGVRYVPPGAHLAP